MDLAPWERTTSWSARTTLKTHARSCTNPDEPQERRQRGPRACSARNGPFRLVERSAAVCSRNRRIGAASSKLVHTSENALSRTRRSTRTRIAPRSVRPLRIGFSGRVLGANGDRGLRALAERTTGASRARAQALTTRWSIAASASARSVIAMAPNLEEVIYDLARAALDEQREVVAGLRSRAAPVLAGAGALAALLARPAIDDGLSFADHSAHATLVCLGILGAVIALLGAILVLATRDFGFSVDVEPLYEAAFPDRHAPEVFLLRIAESHRQRRVQNRDNVRASAPPRRRPSRCGARGRWFRVSARRTLTVWRSRHRAPPGRRRPQRHSPSRPRSSRTPTSSLLRARRSAQRASVARASPTAHTPWPTASLRQSRRTPFPRVSGGTRWPQAPWRPKIANVGSWNRGIRASRRQAVEFMSGLAPKREALIARHRDPCYLLIMGLSWRRSRRPGSVDMVPMHGD
jgi:hypothetical protein